MNNVNVYFVSNETEGPMSVTRGTTVEEVFEAKFAERDIEKFMVLLNNEEVPLNTTVRANDRVSVIAKKQDGGTR